MLKKIDATATLALCGAVFSWSLGPLFLKYFTPYIDGWTANGLRYPISALIYLPFLFLMRKGGFPKKDLWKLALIPTLINATGQILWALTPYYIDPGLMSFLARLSTLWVVIASFFLFPDERCVIAKPVFWIGFFLSAGGFVGLILGGNQSFSGATAIGITLVFFCSLFWAGYQVSIRKYLGSVDSPTAFGMVCIMTASLMIILMFPAGNPRDALVMPVGVALLVVLSGVICIAVAHVLFYFAVKRLGVAISSSTNLGGAFVTVVLSRWLFAEILTPVQWASGVLLVLGGFLLIRTQIYLGKDKGNAICLEIVED